jgi:hypothetical protein
MFDPPAFLQVPLLKLSASLSIKAQAGIAQRGIYFPVDSRSIKFFALAHDHPLFRFHLHPALGVFLKDLSILLRHGEETVARAVDRWRAVWRRAGPSAASLLTVRLSICRGSSTNRNRRSCDYRYKV